MLREANVTNLYLICGYTDMRKGINGLLQIEKSQYELDPYEDSLFLFCGRNARKLKVLYWEGDGFLLMSKALSSKEDTAGQGVQKKQEVLAENSSHGLCRDYR